MSHLLQNFIPLPWHDARSMTPAGSHFDPRISDSHWGNASSRCSPGHLRLGKHRQLTALCPRATGIADCCWADLRLSLHTHTSTCGSTAAPATRSAREFRATSSDALRHAWHHCCIGQDSHNMCLPVASVMNQPRPVGISLEFKCQGLLALCTPGETREVHARVDDPGKGHGGCLPFRVLHTAPAVDPYCGLSLPNMWILR